MSVNGVCTVGYEGRTVAEILDLLRHAAVTRLVDVRALPLSRRRGFSKTPLRDALADAGIDYVHVREAGNPFRSEPGDVLDRYARHLDRRPEILDLVEEALRGHTGALLCLEADPRSCHRSVLADRLKARGYAVRDL